MEFHDEKKKIKKLKIIPMRSINCNKIPWSSRRIIEFHGIPLNFIYTPLTFIFLVSIIDYF
jgi:hypothetical protein